VGCQNYDDQFDSLESQINALASTVAGLSQVQSDLASLAGTVNSLSSTVSGLGSQIDTAVSNGLADIQADIDAIEAAVADVASSEEVSNLSDAVAASQEDLDQLLANSSVYNSSIVINSQATAELYESMGSAINIVNGDVTITVSEDMDQATVQTVVDNILNIVGDLTYTSNASTIAETTFNNLSGVESITAKQGGGYEFKSLASATNIVLNNDYKSTVDIIHLGALTTVTTISDDGGTAGTIAFDKAEEFHLTSLVRYPGNNLNIEIKKGGVLDISSLTDNQSDGTAVGSAYALTVKGPASLNLSTISDGTITVEDVETLTVSGFIGSLDVNGGVETLTVTDIVDIDLAGADDLVTATIDGALDSDANLTTADGAGTPITFASDDLTTATITGITGDINVTSQANLETLVISAEIKNGTVAAPTSGTITVSGNNDLVSLTLTGAKAANVIVNANTDLETLTIDHTTTLAGTDKAGNIDVTGNTNLTSLTISADKVDDLNISGNTQLATIAASDLKTIGTATAVTVLVKTNAFVATTAKDAFDASTATTDTGKFTTSSGLNTLKTYLDAAMAATGTKDIEAYFDTVELVQDQASATAQYADAAHTDGYTSAKYNAIAYSKTSAVVGETVRQKQTYVYQPKENALNAQITAVTAAAGLDVVAGGLTTDFVGTTAITTVTELIAAINADTSFGSEFTVTAAQDAYKKSIQKISYLAADGTTNATTTAGGSLYFTFGTITGTITLGTNSDVDDIGDLVAKAISKTSGRNAATSQLNSYNATWVGAADEMVVYATVSVAGYPDHLGSHSVSIPKLAFTIDAAQTSSTARLSAAASNTQAKASGTFSLGVAKSDLTGIRVTVQNESTVASRVATASTGGTPSAFDNSATALVSGTNTIGTFAQLAGFSDIADASGGDTTTVNRTSWLK